MSYVFSHIFIPLAILLIFSEKLKLDQKKIIWLSFFGIFPDLDVLFFHRGTFHGIFIFIIPILMLVLSRIIDKKKEMVIPSITSYYLLSHLILDIFNGGISALYPFYKGIFFINAEILSNFNIDGITYTLNYGIKGDFVNYISKAKNGYGIVSSENFGIIVLLMIIVLWLFINKLLKK